MREMRHGLLAILLSTACSAEPPGPPEAHLLVRQPDGTFVPVDEGGALLIMTTVTGGFYVAPSVEVRGMAVEHLTITAAIIDETTARMVLESRPLSLATRPDGWAVPTSIRADDYSGAAIVPVCPPAWTSRDVPGEPYLLRVIIEDADGLTVTTERHIVPTCATQFGPEFEASCACFCRADYLPGDCI